ncbi:MAG: alpha/beta hydrolase [Crocinitomicaceae bacterium]|nr:alpha/beta hydrolase [Crocinitomicaceae bacterium]
MKSTEILNYRVSGNGHPVVFLHGFLESKSMWRYLDFTDNILAIQVDLPGHGAAINLETERSSMLEMAKYTKHLIETAMDGKLSNYALVGHSMGGYVGLELMKLDPNCDKVILLNSNFWADNTQKKQDRKRVADIVQKNKKLFLYEAIPNLFYHPEEHTKEVQSLIKEAMEIPAQAIADVSIAMSQREDNSDLVRKRADDICIIQGSEDAIVPVELTKSAIDTTQARYVEVKGSGHMAHIEQPEAVIRIIQDLLK